MQGKIILLLLALSISACQQSQPIAEVVKPVAPVLKKNTYQGIDQLYICDQEKTVRVVRLVKNKKKNLKTHSINLTFNNNTQKLQAAISESGNKYSNLNWHWHERSESCDLRNSLGEVLAKNCIPK